MTDLTIPACYFPSTLVFLHDGGEQSVVIMDELSQSIVVQPVRNKYELLKILDQQRGTYDEVNLQRFNEVMQVYLSPITPDESREMLTPLYAEIYDAKRFAECSVVLLDDHRVDLDFCCTFSHPPRKKILLTEAAHSPQIREAQERGWIHDVVSKNDPHLGETLRRSVLALQKKYFQDLSKQSLKLLQIDAPACLGQASWARYFQSICEKNDIVEYYLLDKNGSFLMLDRQARISYLMVGERHLASEPVQVIEHEWSISYRPWTVADAESGVGVLSYQEYLRPLSMKELSS